MISRNQSEDYSLPTDVLVFRDTPQGIKAGRIVDEGLALAPTTTQLLDAAEALVLQAGGRAVLSVEDLIEQLSLDRGIRFDAGKVTEAAYSLFDLTDEDPARFSVSARWLRNFRAFLASGMAPLHS